MAESTMNQGQQAMEQLIDLQRNMAQMTLSALKWQESAQKQSFEITKSMLENAMGQQLTESMMQSYLQGVEAMMPEMEQMMEEGFEAAAQPQMNQMERMGDQMGRIGSQFAESGRQMQQGSPSGQREISPGRGELDTERRERAQQSQRETAQGMTSGREGIRSQERRRETTRGRPSEFSPTGREGATQGLGQQTGTPAGQRRAPQTGGQPRPSDRSRPQQYEETGEWVAPERYSQRTAPDRETAGRQDQPISQTQQGEGTQPSMRRARTEQSGGRDRNRGTTRRTDEMAAMEEMNLTSDRSSRRPTERRTDEERRSEQQ
ncbi:hypothetical protein [Natrinema caseinilyticum]|uniref:hypothetical protein n=1 Tax=Natrinema caseinilyticum TaxID=2961570 RepID=UPI0020C405A5|nr:hypothetical protein [Natrinema caseinilyticum]